MKNHHSQPKISIIIPAYNEEGSIQTVLDALSEHCSNMNVEFLVINDGSSDNTAKIVEAYSNVRLINHETNQGKGKALQTGFENAKGDILLIQDADMEYHPKDIPILVAPILDNQADVVYGSRFSSGENKSMSWSHKLGNWGLTKATRILYGFKTTDMETGYKVFKRELIEGITLTASSFNIEPELTAIFSKREARFVEVPISYNYREKDEAKISWKDGVVALWWLFKLRFKKYD